MADKKRLDEVALNYIARGAVGLLHDLKAHVAAPG